MRTLLVICLFSVTGFLSLNAQVKIGENPQTIDTFSLLELESGSRTLVITRVNDAQMANMSPLRGAMVYNTDQSCVFYYNGNNWNNLCQDTTNISLELDGSDLVLTDSAGNSVSVTLDGAIEQTFTTDPIINFRESIVITQDGNNFNFEVSEITGENIVDSSINGIDLQDNSITANKLAPNSVGQEELQDNTVTDLEIDYTQVTLSDFTNDPGFITSGQLISPNANNAIVNDNGAFYDDSVIQTTLANTAQDLADHLAEDNDFDPDNERLSNIEVDDTELVFTEGGSEIRVDLSSFSNSGTDDQNLDEVLTQGNSAGGSTIANLGTPNIATDAATKGYVDDAISGIPAGSDNQNLTGATLSPANILEITIEDGDPATVDLSPLAGGVTDGVISLVALNGTDLEFTGAGGGFNGTVPLAGLGGGGADGNDFINDGDLNVESLELTGTGGAGAIVDLSPFALDTDLVGFLTAEVDGSIINELTDLDFDPGTNVLSLTNPATAGGASVDLSPLAGGGGSTEEADQTTIIGLGTNVDPFRIAPGPDGQYLSTTGGIVTWANLPTGTGGTVDVDGVTIEGNGVTPNVLKIVDGGITATQLSDDAVTSAKIGDGEVQTDDIADANITEQKISPSVTDGQVLTTVAGAVQWSTPTATGIVTATAFTGDGTVGNELDLADDAVTTAKILDGEVQTDDIADANVTEQKINPSATDGQVLTTIAGAVQWSTPTTTGIITTTAFTGDGTVGNELDLADDAVTTAKILDGQVQTPDIADNNVTPAKIEEGADGQVLITNGTDVQWGAAPAGASVTGPTIDGDGTVGNPLELADGAVTTAKILDGQVQTPDIADNNVTPAKIEEGADGQVLITNGTDVQWGAAPAGASVTGPTIDGDGTVGNPLELADGAVTTAKILDGQVQTPDIADDNVTPAKIQAGADGQVLITNGTDVQWGAAPAGASVTGPTIDGDGTVGNPLELADDAVTTAKILDGQVQTPDIADDNVTPAKIEPGNANQILQTNGAGTDVTWVDIPAAGSITMSSTDNSISINQTANNFDIEINSVQGSFGGTSVIVPGSIGQADIGTNAIGNGEIQTGAVRSGEILDGTIALEDLSSMGATTTGQVLKWNNTTTAWEIGTDNTGGTSLTPGNGIDITTGTISADVDNTTIDFNGANQLQVADGGITSLKVLDNSLTADDLANNSVTSLELANDAVITSKILNGEVTMPKLDASGVVDGWVIMADSGQATWMPNTATGDGNNFVTGGTFDDATQEITLSSNGGGAGGTIDLSDLVTADELATEASNLVIATGQIQNLTIIDEDVSATAAIDGTKIDPDFGVQLVTTTNNFETTGAGNFVAVGTGSFFKGAINQHPDYVFQKYFNGYSSIKEDYDFNSLVEIEAFVKKYNHLPGIKSAAQVKNEGVWDIGESNIKNLEKIEELFLHTIEQEKKIQSLKAENEKMAQEMEALKKDMALIKQMLLQKSEK